MLLLFENRDFYSDIFSKGYKLIRFLTVRFKRTSLKKRLMNAQFFINEIGYKFNLRKPKSEKPTNIYFVARVKNKQIKISTRVRIYPD